MEKHLLSKSSYVRGVQCSKSLYLYKYHYQQRDPLSTEKRALFNRGHDIGKLAQQLFPGGVDASPASNREWRQSVLRTTELINTGCEVIYEAAFQFEQVLVAVDILVKEGDQWKALEVKSAARISPPYINDAAVQYFVISSAGIALNDFCIVHVNNQYSKAGKINVHELFCIVSVKEEVLSRQKQVEDNIRSFKSVLENKVIPQVNIGEHCFAPYTCDFFGTCWNEKNISNSVFELGGAGRKEQFELYSQGYFKLSEVPSDVIRNDFYKIQIDSAKSGMPFVEKNKLKSFFSSVKYPICFLDVESFMPAIPLFENTRPFQHLPFMYSMHIKDTPESELRPVVFMAEPGKDPREVFLKNLFKDIPAEGSIIVYGAGSEKHVLNGLKEGNDSYRLKLSELKSRMIDLLKPFEEKWYYHPKMKGNFSLKYVLPALVTDMDYSALNIMNGNLAMIAYEQLQNENDMFKILELKENLEKYSLMDTLALAKIFEVLKNETN